MNPDEEERLLASCYDTIHYGSTRSVAELMYRLQTTDFRYAIDIMTQVCYMFATSEWSNMNDPIKDCWFLDDPDNSKKQLWLRERNRTIVNCILHFLEKESENELAERFRNALCISSNSMEC